MTQINKMSEPHLDPNAHRVLILTHAHVSILHNLSDLDYLTWSYLKTDHT